MFQIIPKVESTRTTLITVVKIEQAVVLWPIWSERERHNSLKENLKLILLSLILVQQVITHFQP